MKIEWKASKDNVGVTGYEIFVNGKSIGTVKDDVLTAEIAKLTPKTEYTIEVVAYDAAGNKSAAASVKATTKEGKTPETPTTPEETGNCSDRRRNTICSTIYDDVHSSGNVCGRFCNQSKKKKIK